MKLVADSDTSNVRELTQIAADWLLHSGETIPRRSTAALRGIPASDRVEESASLINCTDVKLAFDLRAVDSDDPGRTLSCPSEVSERLPRTVRLTDGVPKVAVFGRGTHVQLAASLGAADVDEHEIAAGGCARVQESRQRSCGTAGQVRDRPVPVRRVRSSGDNGERTLGNRRTNGGGIEPVCVQASSINVVPAAACT